MCSNRIYFDNNATTKVDREVLEEMMPYFSEIFGNPSSIHAHGQPAKHALDVARQRVAESMNASPEEIIFTSGGTESVNLAITGAVHANPTSKPHVVTSVIEHQAVLNTVKALEKNQVKASYVGVDQLGVVDLDQLRRHVVGGANLVSVMAANNDMGTVEPILEISQIANQHGALFHTDAVQALGKIPFDVDTLGVDLASFSSHKLYGPKGVGALFIRKGTKIAPIIHGGYQEFRKRAGTENLAGIVGFGKACSLAKKRMAEDANRLLQLRQKLKNDICSSISHVKVHGHPKNHLPGTLNVSFKGVEGETLLMALDISGISVSTGSACTSDTGLPSHVLSAMGVAANWAAGSIRFSLGRNNTMAEIEHAVKTLKSTVEKLRI